jgi:hypothetical protein
VPGGILIGDAIAYDALIPRIALGPLFGRIAAADIAASPQAAHGCSKSAAGPAAWRSGWLASTASM